MKSVFNKKNVYEFWKSRAENDTLTGPLVTHNDIYHREVEIEHLLLHLPRGQHILDVGCGDGFSTARYAEYAASVVAIDYEASMINRAKRQYGSLKNVSFEVQDILKPSLPKNTFDIAITQRCLINLVTWNNQQNAIKHIASALKPGGIFIMQEGTQQGRTALNQMREQLGLPSMPPVHYNLNFDEELLWPFLRQYFEIVDVRRMGIYDFVARVVHPLLVAPKDPEYTAKINDVAAAIAKKIKGMEEISREFTAILRKK